MQVLYIAPLRVSKPFFGQAGGGIEPFPFFAVDIFFIISGFWVTRSLLASGSLKTYFLKRIKKIFPLYYTVLFFFALLSFFFTELSAPQYFLSKEFFKYLIANCITLNFLCPSLPGAFGGRAVNGSLWTIKIEVGFYIVLPALIFLMKKLTCNRKKVCCRNVFLAGLYILCALAMYAVDICVSHFNLHHSLSNQLPSCMPFFVSGMICFFNYDFIFKHQRKLILPAALVLVLHHLHLPVGFLTPLALSLAVIFLAFNLKPFNGFGKATDYSYAMYLVHFPLIRMTGESDMFSCHPLFAIVCVIGVSFMAAYILENFIQKKITQRR